MPGMTSCHARDNIRSYCACIALRYASFPFMDDMVSCHVMSGMTSCHARHRSLTRNAIRHWFFLSGTITLFPIHLLSGVYASDMVWFWIGVLLRCAGIGVCMGVGAGASVESFFWNHAMVKGNDPNVTHWWMGS